MKMSSIADAKNNLSHLIHQLDTDEPIHLTRYGKPVAVMMSERQYKNLLSPTKSLNSAILNWQSQLDEKMDIGLSTKALKEIREESAARDFTWDE